MDVLCLCRFVWQITVIFDATVEAAKKFYLQKINVTAPFAETYQTSRLIRFHTIIFSKGWLILCIHMSLGEKNKLRNTLFKLLSCYDTGYKTKSYYSTLYRHIHMTEPVSTLKSARLKGVSITGAQIYSLSEPLNTKDKF